MTDNLNNTGNYNTGHWNTGHYNTGDHNTGLRNTGDCNTGFRNIGNYNTGHYNTGDRNTGNYNIGNCNTGHNNTGDYNAGHWNTGDYNTGFRNTGHRNTGYRNTGHYNTGSYNTGNRNAGFFCTETPKPTFFDIPVDMSWDDAFNLIPDIDIPSPCVFIQEEDMTEEEKAKFPEHKTTGGYLKEQIKPLTETFPEAWKKLNEEEKQKWLNLPNFNAEKFLKITGVDVREKEKKSVVDGEIDTAATASKLLSLCELLRYELRTKDALISKLQDRLLELTASADDDSN